MDYKQYKLYRTKLPPSLLTLDDLSPYELLPVLQKLYSTQEKLILKQGNYLKKGTGVRALIKDLFRQFSSQGYELILPEDIYPVYFDLLPHGLPVIKYRTYGRDILDLPEIGKAIVLISDPIMPQGKYISPEISLQLDDWLRRNNQNWLLIDKVYDLHDYFQQKNTLPERTIYLNSLTKSALTPGMDGWAITQSSCKGFKLMDETYIISSYATELQRLYKEAWSRLKLKNIFPDDLLGIPDVGYLTTVSKNYKALLSHNLAVIPASVFGIVRDDVSVVSCLSEVKHELR